jgi:hypothetical protein
MTLDASGNFLVQATSASGSGATSGRQVVQFNGAAANGIYVDDTRTASGVDTGIIFGRGANTVGAIDTDLTLLRVRAVGDLVFSANSTEAARIDTSGNFVVGNASAVSNSAAGAVLTQSGFVRSVATGSTNSATTFEAYSTGAAAFRFYVGMGGTVFATNTTITAISDQRLKENIRDLDDGLDVVMALKPRKFDWKEGKGANIKNARGFIAQEFETVLPDMIEEWRDPAPEGEEPYKAINANLIPTLVKAIQEQQALITQLTARITALEGA